MEILSVSTEATSELAKGIAKKLKPMSVLALYGDLGSGKTTFTRHLVDSLGSTSRVQSPTFVLMREYKNPQGEISKINHIDLYRLSSAEETRELGLEEIFEEPNSITIIEWPEIIEELLPKRTIKIKLEMKSEGERLINVQNLD